MGLQKRNCGISITLTPRGCYALDVDLDFYGTKISFSPSSAMGDQFGAFVSALYTLYSEGSDGHSEWHTREYHAHEKTHRVHAVTTTVDWDNEGTVMTFEMTKYLKGTKSKNIHLKITTDYGETFTEFTVNEKDLCYAAAKACTDVLKLYGFYGYKYSTGKDILDLHQLLFIKAHALDFYEARAAIAGDPVWDAQKTDFNKEVELLLFDM